ncbi:hypothetical protein Tco_1120174 [Tanacetum coccineum]
MSNQLRDVHVPKDHFPVPTLTKKVLTFMVKKGNKFSGNVTPLFNSMLVQPTEEEGESDPSPRPSFSIPISDSNPASFGGNHRGQSSSDNSLSGNEDGLTLQSVYDLCVSLCKQVTTQAAEIKGLKARIKHLKKKTRPVIHYHKAWLRAVRLKKQQKEKAMGKSKKRRGVSKQGRKAVKSSKGAPSMHTHTDWDDMDTYLEATLDEVMDYTPAQDKGSAKKGGSTTSTNLHQGTNKQVKGTDKQNEGTDRTKVSTERQIKGTAEPKDRNSDASAVPTIVFRDDETIAQFLVAMSQNKAKEKGVELKNVEDIERPRPTSTRSVLTLKPLPKIDPKDKGKGMIEEEDESDTESEDITKAEKKFKMLVNDEEMARKVQEEWEAEEEKERV